MPASDCMEHLAVLPSARLSVCSFHAHSSKRCILGLWLRQNTNSALCLFIFPFYSLNSDCMQCVLGLLWILSLSVSLPHGRPHIGANGVSWPPGKMDEKLKSENMQKKSSFLCLCYILKAIRAGRCRERRYADHIFIQIYFTMHNIVLKFSKFSSPQAARGIDPLTKILRTFLVYGSAE